MNIKYYSHNNSIFFKVPKNGKIVEVKNYGFIKSISRYIKRVGCNFEGDSEYKEITEIEFKEQYTLVFKHLTTLL